MSEDIAVIAEIDWDSSVDTGEPQHDERAGLPSASAYPRIYACPGFLNLYAKRANKNKDSSSPFALSGQHIHLALANPTKENLAALTDDEEDVRARCAHQWAELEAKYGEPPSTPVIEERIFIPDIFTGQIDRASVGTGIILGADYKTGRVPVEPVEANMQLRAYVVLLAILFPHAHTIRFAVIQPWVSDKPVLVEYGAAEIAAARAELLASLKNAKDPFAKRIPGEHCRYCPCKHDCPEAKRGPVEISAVDPALLTTPEGIAAFLDKASMAEKVIEAVRQEAKRRLGVGEPIPGWELKPGRKIETITDPELVFTRSGLDTSEFLGTVKIGKTALKEAIKVKTGAKGKTLDQQLAVVLEGCIETSNAQPSLAKIREPA